MTADHSWGSRRVGRSWRSTSADRSGRSDSLGQWRASKCLAALAHEAAVTAQAQGKFWEMHDLLFENQDRTRRIMGTPTYFVNGVRVVGARSFNDFRLMAEANAQGA